MEWVPTLIDLALVNSNSIRHDLDSIVPANFKAPHLIMQTAIPPGTRGIHTTWSTSSHGLVQHPGSS